MKHETLFGIGLVAAALSFTTIGCAAKTDDSSDDTEDTSEALSGDTCASSRAKGAVAAKERALLDTIATTEGTIDHGDNGYNVTFAYHYFKGCVHHPDLDICSGGYCSTAAGRYQFLYSTWEGLGYSNFEPGDQDRGAMKLIARRGANVPSSRALTATEFVNVMDRISYEWASLPPGRYGQPSYSMSETRAKYCKFAGC